VWHVRRLAACLLLALLAACAHRFSPPAEPRSREVTVGGARFRVRWWPGDDRAAERVVRALAVATPRAQRWGPLAQAVTLTIHRDHDALEAAVHRPGYEWLRAWARYQTIDLQSPRSWGFLRVPDRKLEELLAHELTHCVMYQQSGSDLTWMYKEIPRWFSEGIASVTAGQGYRYGGVEELWAHYEAQQPGSGDGVPGRTRGRSDLAALPGDPIVDPDPLYQDHSHLVYGAAHHAAEFLIRRYGEERVQRVLDLMGKGRRFPAAFEEAIGIGGAEFAADFRRYVVWQGWRR
jgi:hypothetical protein